MINKTRLIIFLITLTGVAVLSLTSTALPPATAAVGTPFYVTSSSCTGPGSFVEAVTLANNNPGHDTISFLVQEIEASDVKCPPVGNKPDEFYIAQVTDSVTIDGNGAKFKGRLGWVDDNGHYNPTNSCPQRYSTIVTDYTPGFLIVGFFGQSNTGLTVVVKDLEILQFNAIAQVWQEASLELEDFTAKEIYSILDCTQEAISAAEGASVSLLGKNLFLGPKRCGAYSWCTHRTFDCWWWGAGCRRSPYRGFSVSFR